MDLVVDVNTTPLIDVMLVLLVMLIITIPIQLHSANLLLPSARSSAPPQEPRVIKIDIDASSRVLWQGELLTDRKALDEKMQAEAAGKTPGEQAELHVRPNKSAKYASLAAVLAAAQRAGLVKIGVLEGQ